MRESLARPYRVTLPLVALMALVPAYLFIAARARASAPAIPATPWDSLIPLRAEWALVYGVLYAFLIMLPFFVVRDEELIGRMLRSYLGVWIAAYVVFVLYPTAASRPAAVPGDGFAAWGLRFLYDADPPYNCFPSLHVAHSFVSALVCRRVHRRLGAIALVVAGLVALSTLFTRQHYLADVAGGIALALASTAVFLRGYPAGRTPASDRRVAPLLAMLVGGLAVAGLGTYWLAYLVLSSRGAA